MLHLELPPLVVQPKIFCKWIYWGLGTKIGRQMKPNSLLLHKPSPKLIQLHFCFDPFFISAKKKLFWSYCVVIFVFSMRWLRWPLFGFFQKILSSFYSPTKTSVLPLCYLKSCRLTPRPTKEKGLLWKRDVMCILQSFRALAAFRAVLALLSCWSWL